MLNFRKISISFFVFIFILSFISTPFLVRAAFGDYADISFDVSDNGVTPINLTFGNDTFWVVSVGGVVNKYDEDWNYLSTFNLDTDGNIDVFGITYYDDALWVVGYSNGFESEFGYGVFEFSDAGVYTENYFMTTGHSPFDIVEQGGFFWMVGGNFNATQYLYKYELDGTDTGDEVLIGDTFNAYGIDFYDDHFWIAGGAGTADYSVYKYDTDGVYADESFEATDFPDFDCDNGCNTGVIYNDGYFWLTDSTDEEVDAYLAVSDATAPTITTLSPADGATGVAGNSNLVITFDEAVDSATGNVTIYKSSDDSVFEAIDVEGGQVTGESTTTITINPSGDLDENSAYYVQIDATAFDDLAGNGFAGIADETTWNFGEDIVRSSSSGSSRRTTRPSTVNPVVPSTNTDGCTVTTAYSPKTGAKCPDVPTPTPSAPTCTLTQTLKQGSTGVEVKCLQNKLQITSDGIFGPMTKASVVAFQQSHPPLTTDGIVGPMTRGVMNSGL